MVLKLELDFLGLTWLLHEKKLKKKVSLLGIIEKKLVKLFIKRVEPRFQLYLGLK